ncbi:uncharacterized protein LOC133532706 [Cydia pomonella]|uniref:uncharacterized protein LOC133532706 n=1 Tax=Cydia pomonella TaxID=82600 RepID=UPI002ADD4D79|nr:uncharacterized protein LOC133532706 [Cydia pomonella]
MRRHLSEQLEDLREMQADMLREHLNTAIITVKNKKYNGEKNDLLDIGDFVYIGGHDKLRAVLRDLEKLGRSTDVRLENVLRHTLRSLIFDHFSKLNYNIKRELIEMAKDYWRVSSSKQWNRQTRPTTLTSLEMDYTSKSDKHVYRNRVSFNAHKRQEISDVRPIQRTKKTYNASQHVNKRYKYRNRIPKDREAVTAFTKLNKYKDITRLTLSDETINPAFEPESDNKTTVENKKSSKVSRKHIKKNKFTPSITLTQTKKPKLSKDDSDKPIDSPYSDFMLLTGGQNVQEVDLRGQSSGETNEDYEEPDKTNEEQQASKKTVAGYHPTAKYLSIERFITIKKKKIPEAKEEKDDKRVVSVTVANISGEGLSIESYENDYDLEIEEKLEKKP